MNNIESPVKVQKQNLSLFFLYNINYIIKKIVEERLKKTLMAFSSDFTQPPPPPPLKDKRLPGIKREQRVRGT